MLALEVRIAWWLRPWLYGHAICRALRGKGMDMDRVGRMAARALRIG